MKKIITVGREFGSGGREFGRRLADTLGIAYYDREIIAKIAERTDFSEEYVQNITERGPVALFPITIGRSLYPRENPVLEQSQTIFQEQSKIIREMSQKSDCVIVGRCADYILREDRPLRIFVYADMESRVKRCRERAPEEENLTDKELRQQIQKIDKNRARYYEFYTGRKWGDKRSYDLCLNTTYTDIKKIVPVIAKIFD